MEDVKENAPDGAGRVLLFSFGFKYGPPVGVNIMWDVRFLPNPYWEETLRARNGTEQEVADYVLQSASGRQFLALFEPMVHMVAREQVLAGGKMLRIAIGCTGGRHRSVAVTEQLTRSLENMGIACSCFHRDIDRDLLGSAC